MAIAYVQQTNLTWPLLLDEDRKLYRAYQMEYGRRWAIYGPASIWNYAKLIVYRPGKDWRQMGGDVLIDPDGVVRLHYVSESPHDRPPVTSILEIVKASQSGG